MPDIVDKLLNSSPEELQKWRFRKKTRKKYKKRTRPDFTKEQLANYLKKKGFTLRSQLRSGRDEGDPTDDDYREAYGSWKAAVDEIFNRKPIDKEYIVKVVIEFDLWTRDGYREARKSRPDVIPSTRTVIKLFGSWGALKQVASAVSLRKTIEAYVSLKKMLERRPTVEDCRLAGVIIDSAVKIYGSKREFDRFIESLEELE